MPAAKCRWIGDILRLSAEENSEVRPMAIQFMLGIDKEKFDDDFEEGGDDDNDDFDDASGDDDEW